MKRDFLLKAAVLALVTFGATATGAQPDDRQLFNDPVDVQEVTRLESSVQLFSNVDDLLKIVHRNVATVGGPKGWMQGWQEVYDAEAAAYAATSDEIRGHNAAGLWWIKDYNIATDGELACVVMHVSIPLRQADGKFKNYAFPELDVWRKYGAEWLAVQLHTYAPMDPKSGKSVTDHEPPHRGMMRWSENPLPGPAGDPTQAKAQLRAWLTTRTQSTDLDQLMTLFGPTDDVVAYTPSIPIEHRGLGEIRASLNDSLKDVRSISAEVLNFDMHSDGMMATILARQALTITMKDGRTRTVTTRHSNCLRRVGDGWRSIMEMISYPGNQQTSLDTLMDRKPPASQ